MSVLPVPNNMNYLLVADAPVAALDPMQELVLAHEPGIYQFFSHVLLTEPVRLVLEIKMVLLFLTWHQLCQEIALTENNSMNNKGKLAEEFP